MSQNPFGEEVYQPPPPAPPPYGAPYGTPYGGGPTISAMAIISLIFACVSFTVMCFCPFAVPLPLIAIVLGHLAVSEIRRSQGRVTGMAVAIVGLVLGYLLLLFHLVQFAIIAVQLIQAGRGQNFR